jgi:hypothetical protein
MRVTHGCAQPARDLTFEVKPRWALAQSLS